MTSYQSTSNKLFLDKLQSAERTCGLYIFRGFLSTNEAAESMVVLDGEDFPWNLKPRLYGDALPQHAYHHKRGALQRKGGTCGAAGLRKLEAMCAKLEAEFDGKITDVYCNRFCEPGHQIEWHRDTFGRHILVLSLGSERKVQFRDSKTREVESITPGSGDLYFMPLALNSTHKHRVCAAENPDESGTRLSFVFLFENPKYAKEFKISTKDRLIGAVEGLIA